MKGLAPLFLGIFGTFAFSWMGLTVIPNWQIGHLNPESDEEGTDIYPQPQSGMFQRGERVYAANGCVYCHSEQLRAEYGPFHTRNEAELEARKLGFGFLLRYEHVIGETEDIQEVRCIFIELPQSAAAVRIIRKLHTRCATCGESSVHDEPWQAEGSLAKDAGQVAFSTTGKFTSNLEFADREKKKAFVESIASGHFHNQADKGAESALSCMMARTAAYTGHEVTWEETLKSAETWDSKIDLNKLR